VRCHIAEKTPRLPPPPRRRPAPPLPSCLLHLRWLLHLQVRQSSGADRCRALGVSPPPSPMRSWLHHGGAGAPHGGGAGAGSTPRLLAGNGSGRMISPMLGGSTPVLRAARGHARARPTFVSTPRTSVSSGPVSPSLLPSMLELEGPTASHRPALQSLPPLEEAQ
jgi:hypothetical protein